MSRSPPTWTRRRRRASILIACLIVALILMGLSLSNSTSQRYLRCGSFRLILSSQADRLSLFAYRPDPAAPVPSNVGSHIAQGERVYFLVLHNPRFPLIQRQRGDFSWLSGEIDSLHTRPLNLLVPQDPTRQDRLSAGHFWELAFPLWSLILLFSFLILVLILRLFLTRSRPGHCPHCNYDLRATPGQCPECGHVAVR